MIWEIIHSVGLVLLGIALAQQARFKERLSSEVETIKKDQGYNNGEFLKLKQLALDNEVTARAIYGVLVKGDDIEKEFERYREEIVEEFLNVSVEPFDKEARTKKRNKRSLSIVGKKG